MATDEEKCRISKLLADLDVPETKLTQRCSDLVMEFHRKYDGAVAEEENATIEEVYENPYKVDQKALDEIDEQLKTLLEPRKQNNTASSDADWLTNPGQKQISRVNNVPKYHHEKDTQLITPPAEEQMQTLIKECAERNLKTAPVSGERLKEIVEQAKKAFPKFQYLKKIENSTALALLPTGNTEQTK